MKIYNRNDAAARNVLAIVKRLKGDRQGGMQQTDEPFRIRDTKHCVNISLLPNVMC